MDKLFYYSGSVDRPAGMGANEQVINLDNYTDLNKIKNWRKILSNFYGGKFIYKGKTYNSAEHAFQSEKIRIVDPDKAYLFCEESGHEIGISNNGSIAQKNRKLVILNKNQIEYWDNIKYDVMKDILTAKFTQVPIAKQVLLLTNNAILLHGTRGQNISRQITLEEIRTNISLGSL